jgi:excisionase family DNA binding protein
MDSERLPRFLTIPQAARAMGIGRHALRAAVRHGELRAVALAPRGWPRIATDELLRWAGGLKRTNRIATD